MNSRAPRTKYSKTRVLPILKPRVSEAFFRVLTLVCLLPLGLRLRENRSPVSAAGAPGSNLPPLAIMIMEIILGAPSLQICAVSILSVV